MQAAIELGTAGINTILIDPSPGKPEAPDGLVTVAKRNHVLGAGDCGQPNGGNDWINSAEGPFQTIMIAGRHVASRWNSPDVLGYNFTRETFWSLMLAAVEQAGVTILAATVTGASRDGSGVVLETTAGNVAAKAVIYAAGNAGLISNAGLIKDLGLSLPALSHGIFANIVFDGEWKSPDICFMFNMELVHAGYFYAAYGKKSSKVSFGIMNDTPTDTALVQRFICTGLVPELQGVELPAEFIKGTLGSVSHVQGGHWPVPVVGPRVIAIGEATGAIGSYIRSGLFESRFQGHLAARVMANASNKGDLGSPGALKAFEQEFKAFDDRVLRYSREQHYAMFHAGSGDAGNLVLDSYLKAFNNRTPVVIEAMKTSYLEDVSMSRFEIGQFGAIISNVPFASKLGLSAHLVAARMQP